MAIADKPTDLSEQGLESVKAGEQAAGSGHVTAKPLQASTEPKDGWVRQKLPRERLNWVNVIFFGVISVLAIYAIYSLTRNPPSAKVVWLSLALYLFTTYGITMGFHRYFTHGSFKCVRPVRWMLIIGGNLAVQGTMLKWVSDHRIHHIHSDKARWLRWQQGQQGHDPHSPTEYPGSRGLWHAHMGWLMRQRENCWVNMRDKQYEGRQLDDDRLVRVASDPRVYVGFVVARLGLPWVIAGNNGFLVAGVLTTCAVHHVTFAINSITHRWGSRTVRDNNGRWYVKDLSTDFGGLFALVTGGESYHNGHHLDEECAFHGRKWYQLDSTKWAILLMERMKLVWDVRKPGRRPLRFNSSQYEQPPRFDRPRVVERWVPPESGPLPTQRNRQLTAR